MTSDVFYSASCFNSGLTCSIKNVLTVSEKVLSFLHHLIRISPYDILCEMEVKKKLGGIFRELI